MRGQSNNRKTETKEHSDSGTKEQWGNKNKCVHRRSGYTTTVVTQEQQGHKNSGHTKEKCGLRNSEDRGTEGTDIRTVGHTGTE